MYTAVSRSGRVSLLSRARAASLTQVSERTRANESRSAFAVRGAARHFCSRTHVTRATPVTPAKRELGDFA